MGHWSIWISGVMAILFWFCVKRLALDLTGFSSTEKIFSRKALKTIYEEFLWNVPGGTKRKIKYLKEHVLNWDNENASTSGWSKSWKDKVVIDNDLFKECALDVLPHWYVAWGLDLLWLAIGFFVPFGLIHGFIYLKNLFITSVCSI